MHIQFQSGLWNVISTFLKFNRLIPSARLCFITACMLLSYATPLQAADLPNHAASPPPKEFELPPEYQIEPDILNESKEDHFYADFVKMLTTLGMLVAAMLFASWFLKRMMRTRIEQQNNSSNIKVIEQRQLSTRASVHLIEVQGRTFLIAESPSSITKIAEMNE